MKRKYMLSVGALLIFSMMVAAPAVADKPCAKVTGGGEAECPVGYPFKIQFEVSVNCNLVEDSKGFVRVTGPFGTWYKVDIRKAAVLDAPPFYWIDHPADGLSRWAAWGPHSEDLLFESIITLQGRAVWAYGEIVATNLDVLQNQLVLFGILSKDQNGGGGPDYIFLPLPGCTITLPDDFYALVDGIFYHPCLYFWLGLDQGHVTFNDRSLD